jgi:hypothetical protein
MMVVLAVCRSVSDFCEICCEGVYVSMHAHCHTGILMVRLATLWGIQTASHNQACESQLVERKRRLFVGLGGLTCAHMSCW